MLILVYMLSFFGEKILLEPVAEESLKVDKTSVNGGGEFFAASSRSLYHWDRDGNLVMKVGGKEYGDIYLSTYFFDGEYYWLCLFRPTEREYVSHIFDTDGNLVSENVGPEYYLRFFRSVDDKLFGSKSITEEVLYQEPYLFLANEIDYSIKDGNLDVQFGKGFFKVKQQQKDFNYNYKLIWIAKRNGRYLVLNQVEPRVYIYDEDAIGLELAQGFKIPSEIKYHSLDLDRYVKPPAKSYVLKKPVPASTYRKMKMQWYLSWSRFLWFGAYQDGFVVAYEIPDCDSQGCQETKLGVQKLDAQFKAVGPLIESTGLMMGVYDSAIHIFEHNYSELDESATSMSPVVWLHHTP